MVLFLAILSANFLPVLSSNEKHVLECAASSTATATCSAIVLAPMTTPRIFLLCPPPTPTENSSDIRCTCEMKNWQRMDEREVVPLKQSANMPKLLV